MSETSKRSLLDLDSPRSSPSNCVLILGKAFGNFLFIQNLIFNYNIDAGLAKIKFLTSMRLALN
jgi:hypothetical protein